MRRRSLRRVSIPLWCDCYWKISSAVSLKLLRFNPTMVRLLLQYLLDIAQAFPRFQSHYGAIATETVREIHLPGKCVSIPLWCDCYSSPPKPPPPPTRVSIPLWCDCYSNAAGLHRIVLACFNPTMVRLLPTSTGWSCSSRICFNPTMVRLLRKRTCFPCARHRVFQSHYGAIAT